MGPRPARELASLGQEVRVAEASFIRGYGIVGDSPKLGDHMGAAAPALLDDCPHLLVIEP
jgi:hypothetical protein